MKLSLYVVSCQLGNIKHVPNQQREYNMVTHRFRSSTMGTTQQTGVVTVIHDTVAHTNMRGIINFGDICTLTQTILIEACSACHVDIFNYFPKIGVAIMRFPAEPTPMIHCLDTNS